MYIYIYYIYLLIFEYMKLLLEDIIISDNSQPKATVHIVHL